MVGALIGTTLLGACGGSGDGEAAAAKSSVSSGGSVTQEAQALPTRTSPPGPGDELAALDGDGRPAVQYQQVLDALAPRCEEDGPRLVKVVGATLKSLEKKGVEGETAFSVLQHLEHWVPAGKPRVACTSEASDYVASRDPS
ncbi:hypothetical protein ACIPSE_29005 [Streptomyces sp. NPDC090106]|uniref:hypothetical protein n=1 Tax=Streptomyces sp. NPDC090106 TaxID=3365946 RepID=UPI0037F78537